MIAKSKWDFFDRPVKKILTKLSALFISTDSLSVVLTPFGRKSSQPRPTAKGGGLSGQGHGLVLRGAGRLAFGGRDLFGCGAVDHARIAFQNFARAFNFDSARRCQWFLSHQRKASGQSFATDWSSDWKTEKMSAEGAASDFYQYSQNQKIVLSNLNTNPFQDIWRITARFLWDYNNGSMIMPLTPLNTL